MILWLLRKESNKRLSDIYSLIHQQQLPHITLMQRWVAVGKLLIAAAAKINQMCERDTTKEQKTDWFIKHISVRSFIFPLRCLEDAGSLSPVAQQRETNSQSGACGVFFRVTWCWWCHSSRNYITYSASLWVNEQWCEFLLRATTPSRKRELKTLKEPALGVLWV